MRQMSLGESGFERRTKRARQKGKQWHFGMQAHIRVDADPGDQGGAHPAPVQACEGAPLRLGQEHGAVAHAADAEQWLGRAPNAVRRTLCRASLEICGLLEALALL